MLSLWMMYHVSESGTQNSVAGSQEEGNSSVNSPCIVFPHPLKEVLLARDQMDGKSNPCVG